MPWIYLSPHFDDAVLSCGGLIWEQARSRQAVEIWTVCAGEIPPGPLSPFARELHDRWGAGADAVAARQAENEAACQAVCASERYFSVPDCIYRRLPESGQPAVTCNDDLWQPYPPGEHPLVEQIAAWIAAALPADARLVSPLAVGGHMDHRLVRDAARRLGRPLWYYADYPYAAKHGFDPRLWLGAGYRVHSRLLSPQGVAAWQNGVAAYTSQISSFWSGAEEMRRAITAYAARRPGHSLWKAGGNGNLPAWYPTIMQSAGFRA